jgi:hypothetical protein
MTITHVQSAKKDVKATNNTTLAYTQNLQQANLLLSSIATFQSTAGTTITTPTDTLSQAWQAATAQQDHPPNTTHLKSFYVPSSTAGACTVTADISGTGTGEITMINSEWSGVSTSAPVSGTPVLSGNTNTAAPSTGTLTPVDDGCLIVAVLQAGGLPITIDISAASLADGWQQVQEYEGGNNSVTLSVIYKVQSVESPVSASWTLSVAASCLMHIMAFRPEEVASGDEVLSDQLGYQRYRDPRLISSIQSPWINSSSAPFKRVTTTVPFDVQSGDRLIALATIQTDTVSAYTFSGGDLTWQELMVQQEDPGAGSTQGMVILASAAVDYQKRMTVTLTRAVFTGVGRFGCVVLIYRDCAGVGNIVKAVGDSATPSLSIDVQQLHSDVVMAIVDNNNIDGATRTWRQTAGALTEITYYRGNMVVYCGYHNNIVRPDRQTVGLLTPGRQQYSMMAAEVKGNPVPDRAMDIAF